MKKLLFDQARFVTSAVKPSQYPPVNTSELGVLNEIAVVGRSNVGKSSLLNHLFRRKGLVKVSATPGKTQLINFFEVGGGLSIADLPGYGYAKVPHNVKKTWAPMIETYFQDRQPLGLVLFLLDIRRTPNDDDKRFIDWIRYNGCKIVIVLTKVDKVKANEKKNNTKKIIETLETSEYAYIHYSSLKNIGRSELLQKITSAFDKE